MRISVGLTLLHLTNVAHISGSFLSHGRCQKNLIVGEKLDLNKVRTKEIMQGDKSVIEHFSFQIWGDWYGQLAKPFLPGITCLISRYFGN